MEYDDYDPNDIPADQAAPSEEGYNYPVPENPLTLPATTTTTMTPLPPCADLDDPQLETYQELGVPLCPTEELPVYTTTTTLAPPPVYDDYDPDDIPEDQAAPAEEVTEGYNYPVPENPLTLPTRPAPTTAPLPLPDCVPAGEEDLGDNPYFLDQGVALCPEELPPMELPVYTTTTTLAPPLVYDDYDPNDIPDDQAAPTEEGYNYPVPENPLPLPTQAPLPACVPESDTNAADLTAQGVPLCPEELPTYPTDPPPSQYDDYDPNDIPADQAAPSEEGYNYPVPDNPLTLPSKPTTTLPLPDCVFEDEQTVDDNPAFLAAGVPLCPMEEEALPAYTPQTTFAPVLDYDDYDPNDVPADQARPTEEPKGYNYPIPENPLILPSRPRKPKLVVVTEDDNTIGLTHVDTDTYDPGSYDHNSPDYIEEEKDMEEEKERSSALGLSLIQNGQEDDSMKKKVKEQFGGERHADPFSSLLGGTLIPPGMKKKKNGVKMVESKVVVTKKQKTEQSRAQKKENDTSGKVRSHKNKGHKNHRKKNKKNAGKVEEKNRSTTSSKTAKNNNSSTTSTSSTTTKPRTGKISSSRSGRRNISVRDWLARG